MSTAQAVLVFVCGPIALFAVISLLVWIGTEVAHAHRVERARQAQAAAEQPAGAASENSGAWWGTSEPS